MGPRKAVRARTYVFSAKTFTEHARCKASPLQRERATCTCIPGDLCTTFRTPAQLPGAHPLLLLGGAPEGLRGRLCVPREFPPSLPSLPSFPSLPLFLQHTCVCSRFLIYGYSRACRAETVYASLNMPWSFSLCSCKTRQCVRGNAAGNARDWLLSSTAGQRKTRAHALRRKTHALAGQTGRCCRLTSVCLDSMA